MASLDIEKARKQLEVAYTTFEMEHPEVAEAMRVMNVSFQEYLQAMASLKEVSATTGNATAQ